MKKVVRLLAWAMFSMMLGSSAFAEAIQVNSPEEAKAVAEKAAMMEKMKALTSPSDAHKVLEPLAGKWNYTAKFQMSPDAPATEMAGMSESEMIYGGRFLRETVRGTWQGQPFEGAGYTGYDNIRQEYVSVWIDGMATGVMKSSGQYDAATKTLGTSGSNSCPFTGEKDRKGRMETTLIDNDHYTMTSYAAGPDGKEYKMMEIAYTRAQ